MKRLTWLKQTIPLIIAGFVALSISWTAKNVVTDIDALIGDKIWQWIATKSKLEQRIIVVDIDEASIAKYGPWPWPRTRLADLSRRIAEQGAGMQIFDLVFATESQDDSLLINQLKSQQVVLAQILAIDADDSTHTGVLSTGRKSPLCDSLFPHANAFIANSQEFVDNLSNAGHITPYLDRDGVVRRMPTHICLGQDAYPALALTALAAAIGEAPVYEIEHSDDWLRPQSFLRHPQLPEITIPLTQGKDLLLPWWLSRQALVSLSAKDVLEGNVPPQVLDGAWVLIGSTAFGTGDAIPTPLAGAVGGVEVHAQLLSALLDNRIPYQPQGSSILLMLWAGVIALFMLLFNRFKGRLAIYGAPLSGVMFAILTLALQAISLNTLQLWFPSMTVILFSLLSGMFIATKNFAENWTESQRLYRNLTSYLPEHAARWIATQDPVSTLSAHHEQVFIMYVDLRNFSNWCNKLPAEQIGAILHTFYKTVSHIISSHGGQTEKYVGDAVMGVWRDGQGPVLEAAKQMLEVCEQQFGEESDEYELPPLALGIGIEYGTVLVGSFGPAQRREYTVIGKAVTSAIKLQEMTTELALPVLIGENAAQKLRESERLESQGEFLLEGAQQAMEIFIPEGC